MKYNYPVSDEKTLYIDTELYQNSIEEIIDQAQSYFFGNISLHNLLIDVENVKITGCSCHYDSSDYRLYIVVRQKGID